MRRRTKESIDPDQFDYSFLDKFEYTNLSSVYQLVVALEEHILSLQQLDWYDAEQHIRRLNGSLFPGSNNKINEFAMRLSAIKMSLHDPDEKASLGQIIVALIGLCRRLDEIAIEPSKLKLLTDDVSDLIKNILLPKSA